MTMFGQFVAFRLQSLETPYTHPLPLIAIFFIRSLSGIFLDFHRDEVAIFSKAVFSHGVILPF